MLRRMSYFMPPNALLKVFNSIVFPHFTYCCTVWCNVKNQLYLDKLFKLQKNAVRILLNVQDILTPTSFLFSCLSWMPIKDNFILVLCLDKWSFCTRFYATKCLIILVCFNVEERLIVVKSGQMIGCQTFYIYHNPKQKITDGYIITRRHFLGTNFHKMFETLLQLVI